jgi:hypothetical protein
MQAATLFFVTGEKAIQHLFSRNTHLEFDYGPLILFLGKLDSYFFKHSPMQCRKLETLRYTL